MLSKQSIRKEHTIYLNDVEMSKEEILEISKEFTDLEVMHFKKMLQQGKDTAFDIIIPTRLGNLREILNLALPLHGSSLYSF